METADLKAAITQADEVILANDNKRQMLEAEELALLILVKNAINSPEKPIGFDYWEKRILEIDAELAKLDQSDAFMVMKKNVNFQKIQEIDKIMSQSDAEYQVLRASADIGRSILNEILEHDKKSPIQKFTSLIKEIFSK